MGDFDWNESVHRLTTRHGDDLLSEFKVLLAGDDPPTSFLTSLQSCYRSLTSDQMAAILMIAEIWSPQLFVLEAIDALDSSDVALWTAGQRLLLRIHSFTESQRLAIERMVKEHPKKKLKPLLDDRWRREREDWPDD